MSTARATLAATHRDLTGKKVAQLRLAGRLPAVVYGHGVEIRQHLHRYSRVRAAPAPQRTECTRGPVR